MDTKLIEETKAYLAEQELDKGHSEAPEALPELAEDANTQWVYIGPPVPWRERFQWSTLVKAAKLIFSLEGLWKFVELAAAMSEVNVETYKREEDPYYTISMYHRITRSRVVLRGDANVDVHANRHVRLNGVLLLQQCSESFDKDPFGAK